MRSATIMPAGPAPMTIMSQASVRHDEEALPAVGADAAIVVTAAIKRDRVSGIMMAALPQTSVDAADATNE